MDLRFGVPRWGSNRRSPCVLQDPAAKRGFQTATTREPVLRLDLLEVGASKFARGSAVELSCSVEGESFEDAERTRTLVYGQ